MFPDLLVIHEKAYKEIVCVNIKDSKIISNALPERDFGNSSILKDLTAIPR